MIYDYYKNLEKQKRRKNYVELTKNLKLDDENDELIHELIEQEIYFVSEIFNMVNESIKNKIYFTDIEDYKEVSKILENIYDNLAQYYQKYLRSWENISEKKKNEMLSLFQQNSEKEYSVLNNMLSLLKEVQIDLIKVQNEENSYNRFLSQIIALQGILTEETQNMMEVPSAQFSNKNNEPKKRNIIMKSIKSLFGI